MFADADRGESLGCIEGREGEVPESKMELVIFAKRAS